RTVFENRSLQVEEFRRRNANMKIEGRSGRVNGKARTKGTQLQATDLRAAAALILAGAGAEGQTEVTELKHLDRGYVNFTEKLQNLGANIRRVTEKQESEEAAPVNFDAENIAIEFS